MVATASFDAASHAYAALAAAAAVRIAIAAAAIAGYNFAAAVATASFPPLPSPQPRRLVHPISADCAYELCALVDCVEVLVLSLIPRMFSNLNALVSVTIGAAPSRSSSKESSVAAGKKGTVLIEKP